MSHPTARPWTPAEEASIVAWNRTLTAGEIARRLKRTEAAVEMRRKRLGLTKPIRNHRATVSTERLSCDPSHADIQAAVNEIRAGYGLPPCEWPVTPDAETQTQFEWRETA